jgi:hypothetical protein
MRNIFCRRLNRIISVTPNKTEPHTRCEFFDTCEVKKNAIFMGYIKEKERGAVRGDGGKNY